MEITVYTAPPLRKWVKWWPQKSPRYRSGFVFRFWRIGFTMRWGFIPRYHGDDFEVL